MAAVTSEGVLRGKWDHFLALRHAPALYGIPPRTLLQLEIRPGLGNVQLPPDGATDHAIRALPSGAAYTYALLEQPPGGPFGGPITLS